MQKDKNIPVVAIWNEKNNQWESGEKNAAEKTIGIWNCWHVKGHLCATIDYGDGNPPFMVKRFHPDGTLAQEGNWYGGQIWLGTFRWIKSEYPTSEYFPAGSGDNNSIVWVTEFDYIEGGIYNAQRYFDKQNRPVSMTGDRAPRRPAAVPARAHYVSQTSSNNGKPGWVMGEVDAQTGKYIGNYVEWNLHGHLTVERIYSRETYDLQEEHIYENNARWCSKLYLPNGKSTQSFYHKNIDPPVVSGTTLYSNLSQDCTKTYFNKEGRELYAVRWEEVNELHVRRYYNGVLVFESIQRADIHKAPVSVTYFYANGATLIDYASNGDGTGWWHMYDESGQELGKLQELEEKERNENNSWGKLFLPFWRSYKWNTAKTDWEAIIENFNAIQQDCNTE
ncbi:hypothetical protein [Chitinophaga flava]|uniref:Toxin-antitoxin system YwqK family antitoxin n=1 Tax=Chitinophaga flava TaxID=2259036 RepID=A0A365Y272_9BACT|nr:hypothetical protein [Chitinophaga flava]RBL91965.1 hypothetical protein DF182_05035 [Chitinophaga flava]